MNDDIKEVTRALLGFMPGDRVVAARPPALGSVHWNIQWIGLVGTIVCKWGLDGNGYLVNFDKLIPKPSCLNAEENQLELLL